MEDYPEKRKYPSGEGSPTNEENVNRDIGRAYSSTNSSSVNDYQQHKRVASVGSREVATGNNSSTTASAGKSILSPFFPPIKLFSSVIFYSR